MINCNLLLLILSLIPHTFNDKVFISHPIDPSSLDLLLRLGSPSLHFVQLKPLPINPYSTTTIEAKLISSLLHPLPYLIFLGKCLHLDLANFSKKTPYVLDIPICKNYPLLVIRSPLNYTSQAHCHPIQTMPP